MQQIALSLKRKGKKISFVPTMGYLHQGHLSLVRIAKKKSDVVVVSIFVNPTQFGPKEDFKRYPRNFARDKIFLQKEGCDYIFAPRMESIYPQGYSTFVEVDGLSSKLEGASRPGHFKGVTTIVAKLFNIVQPDIAVFGQKDAQQAVVIKKMVEDLNFKTKIIIAPTVREKDGLAQSSRNKYLSLKQRKSATVLYKSLALAKGLIKNGEKDARIIVNKMRRLINKEKDTKIDYIAITDTENLNSIEKIKGEVLISLAVKFGKTRLIDNIKMKI
ncbi:MAG: pantoate--beta-alanine ligase [candidate division Zixibacteria bacterium]|nr:pantoate--beta-alanine ligase [candidate division Zixibacteria bacterium]